MTNFSRPSLYGIANCSTVKKARDWLALHEIPVDFIDFKKHALTPEIAQNWLTQIDWGALINRKGLTWRGLTELQKQAIVDAASASDLMLEKNSVIKRPVLEIEGKIRCIGFDLAAYEHLFTLKDPHD
jgi:Spx/MgsR family transcriptional regulator